MKKKQSALLVLGILSGMSGCANLSDSPYYRVWHDRAYGMRAGTVVTEQNATTGSEPSGVIPEAEVSSTPAAQTVSYTDAGSNNIATTSAYAVESDPFKSYAEPKVEAEIQTEPQVQPQPRLRERAEERPMVRDYSNMN